MDSIDDATDSAPEGSTADRLFTNAASLFRRKGYAGTTTRELSTILGLQNASLYHHMSGKEDLLFQLCMGALKQVTTGIEEAIDPSAGAVNQLRAIALAYTQIALNDRDRHATMLIEIRALSDAHRLEVIAARDHNVDRVQSIVAAAQAAGDITAEIEAKYVTLALFNLLNWSIFWWRPDGEIEASKLAEILWTVFATGVTSK
jgi:AcrR family transcriptional regulator